jgi:hypothetical protein
MRDRHGDSRVWRLLACTSAALACAAAYGNTAQAGLEAPKGLQDAVSATVGTATSAVSDVNGTVAGTVEGGTRTAAPASTVVEPTVSSATGAVTDATQTVSDTAQIASKTVDQTIATAKGDVATAVSPATSTVKQVSPALGPVAPGSSTPPVPTQSANPGSAGGDPGTTGSGAEPTPAPASEPVVAGTRVDPQRTGLPTKSKRPAPFPGHHVAVARTAHQTGFAIVTQSTTRHGLAAARRPPLEPIPNAPSSLTVLLGGSGASASFVFAALLGALLLAAFGRPGSRLRIRREVLHPPDVLFQLERPG